MRQLTEEETNYIKPPFVLDPNADKDEMRKWVVGAEAEGTRPPITRTGKIIQIVGEGDGRVLIVDYYDNYVYILNNELPEDIQKKTKEELLNQKIIFKIIGKHNDKLIGSYNAILDFYKTAMYHGKILKGKILEFKKGKGKYNNYALVLSKGDRIVIPASELVLPSFLTQEELINHIVEFVVVEIKKNKVLGSTKIVADYHKEQLNYFFDAGETFKAEVEKVGRFGAFLTYKHNNSLVLRNKDFSANYTACQDVLRKGDTVNVRIKSISKTAYKYIVELVNKYQIDPSLKYEDISLEQEFKGEVVNVQPFGCFVRIAPGRDVLCAITGEKREPVIGDIVTVQITVSSAEREKIRGRIIKYEDEKLDLSKYNLI